MKKLMMIVLPIAVLGVGAVLVMTGIINVPGVTPKSNKKLANALYGPDKDAKKPEVVAKETPTTPVNEHKDETPEEKKPVPTAKLKPELGDQRLAALWNEMAVKQLVAILEDWKDEDAVKVLSKMDNDKVAEVMAALKRERASKLSRALQKEASIVPPPEEKDGES